MGILYEGGYYSIDFFNFYWTNINTTTIGKGDLFLSLDWSPYPTLQNGVRSRAVKGPWYWSMVGR